MAVCEHSFAETFWRLQERPLYCRALINQNSRIYIIKRLQPDPGVTLRPRTRQSRLSAFLVPASTHPDLAPTNHPLAGLPAKTSTWAREASPDSRIGGLGNAPLHPRRRLALTNKLQQDRIHRLAAATSDHSGPVPSFE